MAANPESTYQQRQLRRLRRLAKTMDSAIAVPGTPWRVGLDGLIGLIPGFGDYAGSLISLYIVWQARKLGISRRTMLAMLGNIALEAVVGTVPGLGDAFDFVFRANDRNVALLERSLGQRTTTDQTPPPQTSVFWLILAGLVLAAIAFALPVMLIVLL